MDFWKEILVSHIKMRENSNTEIGNFRHWRSKINQLQCSLNTLFCAGIAFMQIEKVWQIVAC